MTREEAIKFLDDTKVYVNGKSEEIQKKLFSFNFKWCDGSQKVKKVNYPFLFLHNGWISYNDNMIFFTRCSFREITTDDILNINIGEFKSTYRPFKNDKECWNEMLRHQPFGWVIDTETYAKHCIVSIIDLAVYNAESPSFPFGWGVALSHLTFADGTPFGIKEE